MLTFNRLRQRRKKALPRPEARGRLLRIEQLEDRTLLTLLGQSLFPADNPWNQNISQAPVASNSTAIMNAIIGTYGNHNLHPDFAEDDQTAGAPLYGIPYNVVHGNGVPKVSVVIDAYPSESDIEPAPIPANAVLEGDTQTGPTVGLANRGDSHLILYDEDNNIDYEFYHASRPSENSDGMWHADAEAVWNMNTNTFRTHRLDFGRCRGPADSARPGSSRRGSAHHRRRAGGDRPCAPFHPDEFGNPRPIPLSRVAHRQQQRQSGHRSTYGRPLPPQGKRQHFWARSGLADHRQGLAKLWHDRGR